MCEEQFLRKFQNIIYTAYIYIYEDCPNKIEDTCNFIQNNGTIIRKALYYYDKEYINVYV